MQDLSFPELGTAGSGSWLNDAKHRAWLLQQSRDQLRFFRQSLRAEPGFHVLDTSGKPLIGGAQELHATTRMVHSYGLAMIAGDDSAADLVAHGMDFLWSHHRDTTHGGYIYGLKGGEISDDRKLAYGHVFVLLAGATAKLAGHPDADRMISDVTQVLEDRFWSAERGLFADEFNRDWSPFSSYRGMNANMHGIEALLAAYEATGESQYLDKAKRILDFFVGDIAPRYQWRLPEHYTENWEVDPEYEGNPMFRPAGTTPGHSFEISRLLLQFWELNGQNDDDTRDKARKLYQTAFADAADPKLGGFVYTVDVEGKVLRPGRYWWPVTEAIGAAAAFIKLEGREADETTYRDLWAFAVAHLIDAERGGWFPELDHNNRPTEAQFVGKPDIYHSLQASLFPLSGRLSMIAGNLTGLLSRDATTGA